MIATEALVGAGWPALEALRSRAAAGEELARRCAASLRAREDRRLERAQEALWRELHVVAVGNVRRRHAEWIIRHRLFGMMCIDVWGVDRIIRDGGGYQPAEDGEPALILPVYEGGDGPMPDAEAAARAELHGLPPWADPGVLVDLLALPVADPTAILRRRRDAAWLNGRAIDLAAGEQLRVYRSPWSWLQAGAPPDGAVPLSMRRAAPDLLALESIVAEDAAHAEELAAAIRREALKGVPLVHYPLTERSAAAA